MLKTDIDLTSICDISKNSKFTLNSSFIEFYLNNENINILKLHQYIKSFIISLSLILSRHETCIIENDYKEISLNDSLNNIDYIDNEMKKMKEKEILIKYLYKNTKAIIFNKNTLNNNFLLLISQLQSSFINNNIKKCKINNDLNNYNKNMKISNNNNDTDKYNIHDDITINDNKFYHNNIEKYLFIFTISSI
jgi:hypothetical protein